MCVRISCRNKTYVQRDHRRQRFYRIYDLFARFVCRWRCSSITSEITAKVEENTRCYNIIYKFMFIQIFRLFFVKWEISRKRIMRKQTETTINNNNKCINTSLWRFCRENNARRSNRDALPNVSNVAYTWSMSCSLFSSRCVSRIIQMSCIWRCLSARHQTRVTCRDDVHRSGTRSTGDRSLLKY